MFTDFRKLSYDIKHVNKDIYSRCKDKKTLNGKIFKRKKGANLVPHNNTEWENSIWIECLTKLQRPKPQNKSNTNNHGERRQPNM